MNKKRKLLSLKDELLKAQVHHDIQNPSPVHGITKAVVSFVSCFKNWHMTFFDLKAFSFRHTQIPKL